MGAWWYLIVTFFFYCNFLTLLFHDDETNPITFSSTLANLDILFCDTPFQVFGLFYWAVFYLMIIGFLYMFWMSLLLENALQIHISVALKKSNDVFDEWMFSILM